MPLRSSAGRLGRGRGRRERHSSVRACTALLLGALSFRPVSSDAAVEGQSPRTDAGAPHLAAPRGDPGTAGRASDTGRSTLPSGHPPVQGESGESNDDELPPGHPAPTGQRRAASKEQALPEDTSDVDEQLAPGTIVVEVRDRFDRALANADVTLGILQQSVAKGESRRRTTQKADAQGDVRFDGLEPGAGVAYRVTVPWGEGSAAEPATYAAMPFQLDLQHGQRVRVHVYPVTNRVEDALVGMQGIVYIELKDDALQIDELFQVYNVGTVTWVPSDLVVALPSGFRAFNAQKEMSDTGFDEVPGRGAKLRGTFSPGQHETHFRYQLPYDGGDSFELTLALPPRVARMRVIAESSKSMSLKVADFPNAIADRNQRGQRVLVTERNIRTGDSGISRVRIDLDNIPTEGQAKWIAVAITALTVGLGLYVALEQEKKKADGKSLVGQDAERARARLVAEIAALDRAHQTGEIGPKAYLRVRDALIDSLARVMAFTHA